MKYKVLIDPLAKLDMMEIFRYVVSNDTISAAEKLLNSIENSIYKLEEHPERGHIPQELRQTGIKRYLEIDYKPFRIIYEIDKKLVYVYCILDERRSVQEILSERLLR